MSDVDQVVLWPREEDYPRFAELSDEPALATYREFVAVAQPFVDTLRKNGFNPIIVHPDLDLMVDWCRTNFGKVDSAARAAYGAFVALNEPTDGDSLH